MLGSALSDTQHAWWPDNVRVTQCINRRKCPQDPGLNSGPTDKQLSPLGYGRI